MLFGDKVRPSLGLETFTQASLLSEKIKKEMVDCARAGFGDPRMSVSEIHDHLVGTVDVVTDYAGKVVGFGSTTLKSSSEVSNGVLPSKVQKDYFAGAVVDPTYQGTNAYGRIIDARLQRIFANRSPALLTRTQEPKVESKITQALEIAKLRKEIVDYHLTRTHLQGFYGRMLTAKRPHILKDSPYDSLDYKRGDAFVLEYTVTY